MTKHKLSTNMLGTKPSIWAALDRMRRTLILLVYLVSLVGIPTLGVKAASTISFTGEELLGKPTDTSITINIVPATTIEYHYQYGTSPGSYSDQTLNYTATGGQPHEIVIIGLSPNTQYYYQMQYHAPGNAMDDWVTRSEHSFWTQRAEGSSFTFTVTSDSHAQFTTAHQNAMTNILNEHPDFDIDLGDTFYSGNASSQTIVNNAYLAYREPAYMDRIGGSVPIYLAAGNHEDEEGWNLDDTPFSPAVGSIQARKAYFPTPINDGFYSGNTDTLAAIDEATYGDEYREDYYAWTWGDALFVVIDEYQYTMANPYGSAAGEGSDDPDTADQWIWTLGKQQYDWFKETLENSDAKYKFVFSHHVTGGITRNIVGVDAGYVRGGAEAAAYFEWGGKNADGSEGFEAHRPGWGGVPIHQLMVANGVSAYFHGHDHQYAYERRDGIVYQEVPSPSMSGSGFSGIYTQGDYSDYSTIRILPNAGHLRISISPSQATVEYVSSGNYSSNGTINYNYTILPNTDGERHILTTAVSPSGSGTISPAAGAHVYDEGEVVSITAAPNTGYAFSNWSGDCTGSGACQVTMDGDKSVTAQFLATPNQAPVVGDIPNQTITEGSPFTTINLDDYVSDPDNSDAQMSWSYSGQSQLSVNITNRVATITPPNADWNGAETITFRATDPGTLFDEDAATFTVTGVNDAPVVSDIPNQTITEGSSFVTINLDNYVSDPDNSDAQMSWSYSGQSQLSVNITNRVATITAPNVNWNGAETITFRATDPGLLYDEDTATFTVTAVNDAPVCSAASLTTDEDTPGQTAPACTDADGDTLSYSIAAQPANGMAAVASGILSYSPAANFNGADSFTYQANDGTLNSNVATVSVSVTPVNDAPVLSAIGDKSVNELTALSFTAQASDVDGDELTFSLDSGAPTGATIQPTSGLFSWTPSEAQGPGSYPVTVRVSDGTTSDSETLTVSVAEVNQAPAAAEDAYTIEQDTPLNVLVSDGVLANDQDADGDAISAVLINLPVKGVLILNSDGSFTYTPEAGFTGTVTFTYRAYDGQMYSAATQVRITVTGTPASEPNHLYIPLFLGRL